MAIGKEWAHQCTDFHHAAGTTGGFVEIWQGSEKQASRPAFVGMTQKNEEWLVK
jgi:hypothetical protein